MKVWGKVGWECCLEMLPAPHCSEPTGIKGPALPLIMLRHRQSGHEREPRGLSTLCWHCNLYLLPRDLGPSGHCGSLSLLGWLSTIQEAKPSVPIMVLENQFPHVMWWYLFGRFICRNYFFVGLFLYSVNKGNSPGK